MQCRVKGRGVAGESENSAISLQSVNENYRVFPRYLCAVPAPNSLNVSSREDSNPTLCASFKIAAKHAGPASLLLFLPGPVTENREESLASQHWIQGNLMADRTATLYIRTTTSDGRKCDCTPVSQSKGRLKPQHATVNSRPVPQRRRPLPPLWWDGGKQLFVLVGKDPYVALGKLSEKEEGSATGNGGPENSR